LKDIAQTRDDTSRRQTFSCSLALELAEMPLGILLRALAAAIATTLDTLLARPATLWFLLSPSGCPTPLRPLIAQQGLRMDHSGWILEGHGVDWIEAR
jgi:hypothetical protein